MTAFTKGLAAGLLLCAAFAAGAQAYRLPFAGRWFVAQGGDTLNVNHHMALRAQWYGIDFMKTGGPDQRSLARGNGAAVEEYFSWDAPVLSPVAGEVVAVVDALPDNPIGTKDPGNPAGNHVVIRVAADRYVFLAHLRRKSTVVEPGQRVIPGQQIGRCGNSGNSDAPHIHMHVQDTARLNMGAGRNMIFSGIDVEMTGKAFRAVDWPLIRGLFVSN